MAEAGLYTEHARFQLEAGKLGRELVFQVTVLKVQDRKGQRLYAETQVNDPYHFLIQFIIREAQTLDEVIDKFVSQLRHRGYRPRRFRTQPEISADERWGNWSAIPPTPDEIEADQRISR